MLSVPGKRGRNENERRLWKVLLIFDGADLVAQFDGLLEVFVFDGFVHLAAQGVELAALSDGLFGLIFRRYGLGRSRFKCLA